VVLSQVGLNPDEYLTAPSEEMRKRFSRMHDEALIGFIGRLVPEKGVILLL